MEPLIHPVCVIGGGAAGTMAVLRTILNNDQCLFFPGSPKDKKRSRALWVRKVENMPAHFQYKRGIEDPNLEALKWISESAFKENLIIFKNVGVQKISKNNGLFELTDSKGQIHFSRFVILCTGVMDVQPIIQGSISAIFDYANAQTIDYCIICDGHHVLNKKTTVIGHSNVAAWVSIILHERYKPKEFTILTNGAKTEFQDETWQILKLYNIKVIESPIKEILGEDKGRVLQGFFLEDGQEVESEMCFVSMGMLVYNDLAKQLNADIDDRGFVKADESGLTSIPALYVAGDLKAGTKKQIYTSWDTAVNSANSINGKLRAARRDELLKQQST